MVREHGDRIGAYQSTWFGEPDDPVARAIKAARRKDRRTQEELAEDIGIKRSRLAQYETGRRRVPWHLWGRLTEELPALAELEAHPAWPRRFPEQVVSIVTRQDPQA